LHWAIINGEAETGATLHYIDAGIDTGPVIAEERFPIEPEDDAASVRDKLCTAGARLLRRWWPAIADGTAPRTPQDESRAKYYPLRTPEDGRIDWSAPASRIRNLVRALASPWPGAFTTLGRDTLILRRVALANSGAASAPPGVVSAVDGLGVRVGTGAGDLLIVGAEIDGQAADLHALGLSPGTRLGS
jgi:UDP-4-amino-4-deoxy-L-arabinose formyltransferase/UDP-glucuronic acid dehydrogenase (UDP-4-keto-hexauronic acid decarboxylating)